MTFQPSERPVVTVTRLFSPQFWHGSWDASVVFPILFVTSYPSSHPCVSRSTRLFTLQDQTHDDFFSFYHQPLPMGECCIRLQKWSSLEVCPSLTWVCTLHGGPCGSSDSFLLGLPSPCLGPVWLSELYSFCDKLHHGAFPEVPKTDFPIKGLLPPALCTRWEDPHIWSTVRSLSLPLSVWAVLNPPPPTSFQTTLLSHHPAELPARSWSSLEFVLLPRDPSQAAFCFFCVLSQTAAAWPPW